MLSLHAELQALTARLHAEEIPYALCGALALAVHGYPRATLNIDLLAIGGSGEGIRRYARSLGFTLEAAPGLFAAGTVQIRRLSKAIPALNDVLMLNVLSLPLHIEREVAVEIVDR